VPRKAAHSAYVEAFSQLRIPLKFLTAAPNLEPRDDIWPTEKARGLAGLWRPAKGDIPEAFTLLTTEPGPDVALTHDRQMVVLERTDWQAWLDATKPESELLLPLPRGSLQVEQVR
jgi:hypothetical protein